MKTRAYSSQSSWKLSFGSASSKKSAESRTTPSAPVQQAETSAPNAQPETISMTEKPWGTLTGNVARSLAAGNTSSTENTILQTKQAQSNHPAKTHPTLNVSEIVQRQLALQPRRGRSACPSTSEAAHPTLNVSEIVQRQSASQRGPILQPKLTLGAPGDKYEQEADRVAKAVVYQIQAPKPQIPCPPPLPPNNPNGQGLAKSLQTRSARPKQSPQSAPASPKLQLRATPLAGKVPTGIEASIHQARGGGQSLPTNLQHQMGQAMGADVSRVRIHADSRADRLSRSLQAKAFTVGQDVFFRRGAYHPRSRSGQELIAHELTHTQQQTRTPVAATTVQRDLDP